MIPLIEIFKTVEPGNELICIEAIERGCWVNLTNPTEEELEAVIKHLNVEQNMLRDPLDSEEKPRVDIDEDQTLIIVDIPYVYEEDNSIKYETVPMGIMQVRDDFIITISSKQTSVLERFRNGQIRNFYTYKKTRFILQILYNIAEDFLKYLRHIDKKTEYLEKTLHKSMRNKELYKLMELAKPCLFHYITEIKRDRA